MITQFSRNSWNRYWEMVDIAYVLPADSPLYIWPFRSWQAVLASQDLLWRHSDLRSLATIIGCCWCQRAEWGDVALVVQPWLSTDTWKGPHLYKGSSEHWPTPDRSYLHVSFQETSFRSNSGTIMTSISVATRKYASKLFGFLYEERILPSIMFTMVRNIDLCMQSQMSIKLHYRYSAFGFFMPHSFLLTPMSG